MFNKWIPVALVVITLIGFSGYLAWIAPQLPENVSSHFDAQGNPDNHMSRSSYLVLVGGIQFGVAALMIGLIFLIKRMPPSFINIPHREYWLVGKEKERSLTYITTLLWWITLFTLLFFYCCFYLGDQVNLGRTSVLGPSFYVALGIYLVLIFAACGHSFIRFKRPINNDWQSD